MKKKTVKHGRRLRAAGSRARPAPVSKDSPGVRFYAKRKKDRRYGLKEQLGKAESAATVPILCRFWFEDGVWNGVAEDLAVAAFGGSFEEAMANLRMAIESHLESVLEAGEVGDVVKHLEQRAKEYGFLSLDEVSPRSPLVKMLVAIRNSQLVAVT